MTKINFSLECDEVLRTTAFSETELFNGEKAKGKKVLIIDPVTNIMQVAYCREPKTENRNYPIVNYYALPIDTLIIGEEEDTRQENLMQHVQDCCDKVCATIQEHDNHMAVFLGKEIDALKSESVGNGISEKTLLSALEIVANKKEL